MGCQSGRREQWVLVCRKIESNVRCGGVEEADGVEACGDAFRALLRGDFVQLTRFSSGIRAVSVFICNGSKCPDLESVDIKEILLRLDLIFSHAMFCTHDV